jgi:hypothetical protein
MDPTIERIQYLTKKAQMGVIDPYEQNELARLIGRNNKEFTNKNDGLSLLIGLALAFIAAAILAEILGGGRRR